MSSDCLCVCENMCSCPCHNVTCICCPCGKDRQDSQYSKINYYKNLYEQAKSELECEKRKNDKMMYDKQMQKNDLQNCENEQNSEENDMIFLCIIIIKDPIQVDIKDTIEKCKNSFINLIVTTGDNIMTATSIAKECGILNESLDLNNLDANDIEQNPNLIDDQSKKNEYTCRNC